MGGHISIDLTLNFFKTTSCDIKNRNKNNLKKQICFRQNANSKKKSPVNKIHLSVPLTRADHYCSAPAQKHNINPAAKNRGRRKESETKNSILHLKTSLLFHSYA
jgi:hypothetical protein